MSQVSKIILVDDDPEMRAMLADFLAGKGHQVETFGRADLAFEKISKGELEKFSEDEINLVITDMNMPGMDGLEFIQRMSKRIPDTPKILITAFGSIETAIEATKQGVYSYVVKPFKLKEFAVTVTRALDFDRIQRENKILRSEIHNQWQFENIIGKSKPMLELFDLIRQIGKATANILVTGESGTGKEVVARAIHASGPRKEKPFVAINCAAIPDSLLESELFGHLKGSFTGAIADKVGLFEAANGGTLFLDEIGDLDLALQAKVLRAIQEKSIQPVGSSENKKIDVRIVAATHRNLQDAIQTGEFREDLFYRLCVIPVEIPPLRDRREDIPLLANFFLKKYATINGSRAKEFSSSAMSDLLSNQWPGNVRELENLVERMVVLAQGETIESVKLLTPKSAASAGSSGGFTDDWPTLAELELRYIKSVLIKVGGKKEKAAEILGINRRTLYRKEIELEGNGNN